MDRNELLTLISDGRTELEAALARFDDKSLTEPLLPNSWSVKDFIGHVGFWEQRIATLYEILTAGEVPQDTIADETLDELNGRVYAENRLLPLGLIRMKEAEAFQAIQAVAENAPEEDLFDPQRFSWTQGEPFYNWIAVNTYEHYADHLPDLLAAQM